MWSLAQAHQYAGEVEAILRSTRYRDFLTHMYGNTPALWQDSLQGYERLRVITNYLTRMRFLHPDGALELDSKSATPDAGALVEPWFDHIGHQARDERIIFGHWAALEGKVSNPRFYATDTGCVWGRELSMYCLDNNQWHRCACD
jgi:bis(5'-nucleosyl)-tetraphosphatase (symmetrical)